MRGWQFPARHILRRRRKKKTRRPWKERETRSEVDPDQLQIGAMEERGREGGKSDPQEPGWSTRTTCLLARKKVGEVRRLTKKTEASEGSLREEETFRGRTSENASLASCLREQREFPNEPNSLCTAGRGCLSEKRVLTIWIFLIYEPKGGGVGRKRGTDDCVGGLVLFQRYVRHSK